MDVVLLMGEIEIIWNGSQGDQSCANNVTR